MKKRKSMMIPFLLMGSLCMISCGTTKVVYRPVPRPPVRVIRPAPRAVVVVRPMRVGYVVPNVPTGSVVTHRDGATFYYDDPVLYKEIIVNKEVKYQIVKIN